MELLHDAEISRIRDAAVSARLDRVSLLAGLNRFLVAEIPAEKTGEHQLFTDLRVLSKAGKMTDGSVPLEIWLKNAAHLSGSARVETDVFRGSAAACKIAAMHIPPTPSRVSWGTPPSPVLSILAREAPSDRCLFQVAECLIFLDAVTELNLATAGGRKALLAGISTDFVNDGVQENTAIEQIAIDVTMLGRERFVGLPIARWLANACYLASFRRDRTAFSDGMAELVKRTGNPDLLTSANPPLATTIESIIGLAAVRPLNTMFAGLDPALCASVAADTSAETILLLFYYLYMADPAGNGEHIFPRWLRQLRRVAELTDSDPLTTKMKELEARYFQSRRT